MAKRILLVVLVALGCFAASSCHKASSVPSPEVLMRADVNALPWISYEAKAYIERSTAVNLNIEGDSSGSKILLHIQNFKGVGEYLFAEAGNTATFYSGGSPDAHVATSGKLVITESKQISATQTSLKGTFEFLADVVPVTNGSFNLNISLD
ncbi:MAG: hypothetical protein EBZ77_07810 [Chitinophagia bacterium]|nr:hypothetical protein [Chitinophagia bacterium]